MKSPIPPDSANGGQPASEIDIVCDLAEAAAESGQPEWSDVLLLEAWRRYDEARDSVRVAVDRPARLLVDGQGYDVMCENLGLGGALIAAPHAPPLAGDAVLDLPGLPALSGEIFPRSTKYALILKDMPALTTRILSLFIDFRIVSARRAQVREALAAGQSSGSVVGLVRPTR